MKGKSIVVDICASLLILLFLYAALSKWLDMHAFRHSMLNQPFPKWMAISFTWFIPPIEILIAVLLMFKNTQRIGFAFSLILMSLFTIYIGAILLHFFPRVPCSCGGVIQALSWEQHLIFNLFFVLISVIGVRSKSQPNDVYSHQATA